MEFVKMFFRMVALLPGVIHGTEAMFGKQTGEQKKKAALEIVGAAINITDAVTTKQIADSERFTTGLGAIIDGVVTCLNASVWAKQ
ncbi:MAG: hypothetical protein M3Y50_09980 [Acidobacteriota bacterium]|nr:hypothetical protein [Acidobacteriota bacterium]